MTKLNQDATPASYRPVQIEVTQEMIEAGVGVLENYAFLDDFSLVKEVYTAMTRTAHSC